MHNFKRRFGDAVPGFGSKNKSEATRMNRKYQIELEQESDGRWIAEIEALSGAMVYAVTREQAIMNIEALALRILADRLEHGEVA
jgi:predicted RNase H-like HicB family nuclease